jgi:predicted DNA-binding transcriptional regulator AlpA
MSGLFSFKGDTVDNLDRLLSIKEMAEISNMSESYFYTNRSLKKLGDLEFIAIGRAVRVRARNFYAWLDNKVESN